MCIRDRFKILSDSICAFLETDGRFETDADNKRHLYTSVLALATFSSYAGIFWDKYHIHKEGTSPFKTASSIDRGGHTPLNAACFSTHVERAKNILRTVAWKVAVPSPKEIAPRTTASTLDCLASPRIDLRFFVPSMQPVLNVFW